MLTAITAFLSGVKGYALLAVGVLILVLAGAVALQYEEHKADVAEKTSLEGSLHTLQQSLAQSEADKAALIQKQKELDQAVKERDARMKALNDAKRKLADELDGLKKTLPAPDQDCFSRDLPPSVLDLLRDSADGYTDDHPADPGKPALPVPEK